MPELAQDHTNEIREEEPDLIGLGVTPSFGIGQRALLVRTPAGNVLWDCVSLLDEPPESGSVTWAASPRSRCPTRTSKAPTSRSPTPSMPGS